MRVFAETCCAY